MITYKKRIIKNQANITQILTFTSSKRFILRKTGTNIYKISQILSFLRIYQVEFDLNE